MAYTVLARKYRSRTFDEVIGQAPIARTLVNAIKTGRIHHGYLFTGTRGAGKTSMARILSKALNCLKADAPTLTPCLKCDSCVAIAEGQDIDVVEIDAASNTGVDNIRELRGNTAYRPARARFKIYIIDEVHMLSTGAFNALLKTLEEPPEHVKFILATTEVQKVPATIQSRCQRFNFRNIGPEDIARRLESIVQEEGATAEPAVLRRVARLANGSMRDALSILDQLLSVSPMQLTASVLDELLPPAQDEQVFKLLQHVAAGDAAAVLTELDGLLAAGRGLDNFAADAIELVRTLLVLHTCGPDTTIVDVPAAARAEYVRLAGCFEASHYVQMIAMLEELRRNVRFSGAGRALTDALLVRFANLRQWAPIEQILRQLPGGVESNEKKKSPAGLIAPRPAEAEPRPAAAPIAARTADMQAVRVLPPESVERRPSPTSQKDNGQSGSASAAAAAVGAARGAAVGAPGSGSESRPGEAGGVERAVISREAIGGGRSQASAAAYDNGGDGGDQPGVTGGAAAGAAGVRQPVSAEERARIMQDALVRQVVDLFDGIVIEIDRRTAAEAGPAAIDNLE